VGGFDIGKAEEILGVPEGYGVVVLMPIEYPAKRAPAPKRREIAEFIHKDWLKLVPERKLRFFILALCNPFWR